MSLALAIKNAAPKEDTNAEYKKNVVAVNTLMTSVLTSSLPTLNNNPPDWGDFVTAYVAANADALGWVNNVMARLLDVPDEVRNYNSIITLLLNDAKEQAQRLVDNPSDKPSLAILNNDLSGISSQLNIVNSFISGAVRAIEHFQDTLPDMANQLQTIADKSSHDADVDQDQIEQLKADIESLQSEIESLTASIIALGIADGVALTLGTVATIAAWPVGALTWLVMGPVVAISTTYIALDALKIKADKEKIDADQEAMTGLTADVATLHVLAQNYSKMAEQTQKVEANLKEIQAEWLTLEKDVEKAIDDIKTAINDIKTVTSDTSPDKASELFSDVLKDINNAVAEWNDAYSQAGSLHFDLKVNDAQLEYGMTEVQIQSAMSTGKTVGIIEYYNNLNNAA
ncbi:MAG: hypothetical protein ACRC7D_10595 [Aeromonas popoffii]|uniref:hypothetical protein n=1 Tax=Aeromonas popoffii TaxID=70856 RepID=UPI003F39A9D1